MSIPIVIPIIAVLKQCNLRGIIPLVTDTHGFHLVETLGVFVVFGEIVCAAAGGEAVRVDV